jgi:hypothetical protein
MLKEAEIGKELEKTLSEIDLDKLQDPNSDKAKEGLTNVISILERAKQAIASAESQLEASVSEAVSEMRQHSQGSRDAADFLAGAESALNDPNGNMALSRKLFSQLSEMYDALIGQKKFLLERFGRFEVDATGQILFGESVTEQEIKEFNEFGSKAEAAAASVESLEKQIQQNSREAIEKGRSQLR